MHPLVALWEMTGHPGPNWQGKAVKAVAAPSPRRGICALTGEHGPVWPLNSVTTTLTTLDRLPHRNVDPAGCALGEAAAWALRLRVAMQQPHVAATDGPLRQATPADLYAALEGMHPGAWVLVPQSRQKHLLPWATPGMIRVDDGDLIWGDRDRAALAAYARLRAAGFGERALAEAAPSWVVMRGVADRAAILADWPLLDRWRAHPAYLDVAARATRTTRETIQ